MINLLIRARCGVRAESQWPSSEYISQMILFTPDVRDSVIIHLKIALHLYHPRVLHLGNLLNLEVPQTTKI